jgi:hypothetical protein
VVAYAYEDSDNFAAATQLRSRSTPAAATGRALRDARPDERPARADPRRSLTTTDGPQAYVQGYQPFAFNDFSGGLNLRDKADTVGDKEAIDLLNVTFSERGAIRQRDGYADLTTADLTNRVDSLAPFYTAGGVKQLVAGCGTRLEASTPPALSSRRRPG